MSRASAEQEARDAARQGRTPVYQDNANDRAAAEAVAAAERARQAEAAKRK